ncbi:hypothetical protein SMACR_02033 [Sordaria macrospora]|uniref:WGS project CABT00000000 data, contig 2.18 n=2 Tax=Sordaria macrospora TaxID=5147 RepID=F7W0S3_SORMK|nr:uncharacterized protein SMAC_02033 [Sordaria macrospora k-hell]KAA8632969.1 hypothetical protein SMACR_02033 [Sordaria macrospora]WPJ63888.1 hypothetical protein SMAC4_02033 [Sordaria macrospora]CCC11375.1 unnamed protein product [Sordaria macrospora k-hell]
MSSQSNNQNKNVTGKPVTKAKVDEQITHALWIGDTNETIQVIASKVTIPARFGRRRTNTAPEAGNKYGTSNYTDTAPKHTYGPNGFCTYHPEGEDDGRLEDYQWEALEKQGAWNYAEEFEGWSIGDS